MYIPIKKLFYMFQLENNNDHLTIYDGGSDQVQMIANLTGQMNETKISIFGNQMFVVFHTNEVVGKTGFRAIILQSKPLSLYFWCYDLELLNIFFSYLVTCITS